MNRSVLTLVGGLRVLTRIRADEFPDRLCSGGESALTYLPS